MSGDVDDHAIAVRNETLPQGVAADDPFALIAQCVQRGDVDVQTLKELCDLQREMKADRAKEAFVVAMAAFQAECPVIEKKKPVKDKNGVVRYHYAPIDDIIRQVGGLIAKHGFSYDFDTEVKDGMLLSKCIVTHKDGHTRTREFSVPIGSEQFMTEQQKYSARRTISNRQSFCNAFGITTGDEDRDGADDDGADKSKRTEPPTGEVMSEAELAGRLNAIRECKTLEYLRSMTKDGLDAAKAIGDRDAYKAIQNAGTMRSKEIGG